MKQPARIPPRWITAHSRYVNGETGHSVCCVRVPGFGAQARLRRVMFLPPHRRSATAESNWKSEEVTLHIVVRAEISRPGFPDVTPRPRRISACQVALRKTNQPHGAEANSCSPCQENLILWNPKIHRRVHNSQPVISILRRMESTFYPLFLL